MCREAYNGAFFTVVALHTSALEYFFDVEPTDGFAESFAAKTELQA